VSQASATLPEARRVPLSDETATILRTAILRGELAPRSRLNEARLAQQLRISRGPVREALRGLEQEGFIVSVPHRGSFVTEITADDVTEMLAVRERLEPLAIERAMAADRVALLGRLAAALELMRAAALAVDEERHAEAHIAYHSTFYEGSQHRLLLQIWERLKLSQRLYFRLHGRAFPTLDAVTVEHERLLTVLRSGNAIGIAQEVSQHFHTKVARIVSTVREQIPLRQVPEPLSPRSAAKTRRRHAVRKKGSGK
jgi:DNA-binding GntR family transcriptional regulator